MAGENDDKPAAITGHIHAVLPSVKAAVIGRVELDAAVETTAAAVDTVLTTLDDQTVFLISEGTEKALPENLRAWSFPLVTRLAKYHHIERQRRKDRVHNIWAMLLVGLLCAFAGVVFGYIIAF